MSTLTRTDSPTTSEAVFEIRISKHEQQRMDRMLFAELEVSLRDVLEAATGEVDPNTPKVRRKLWVLKKIEQLAGLLVVLLGVVAFVLVLRVVWLVVLGTWNLF